MGLFSFLTQDIAIDLGTANTIIIMNDKMVVNEPSIVAVDKKTEKVIAIGERARQMQGKTHEYIKTIRPLRDGVIADFNAAEQMIRGMIKMANGKSKFFSPSLRIVVCIPSGSTEVELRAVRDSAEHAGGRDVYMIYEPMAAALGIGLDVEAPEGNMIVDIGGGTTEIAVISLGGIVTNKSIRIAGDDLTDDIQEYMRHQHNIKIGERTAEEIKIHVGSALSELDEPPADFVVQGPNQMTSLPVEVPVSYQEIAHCIEKSISKIEIAILAALEQTPPELYADIVNKGIYLAGGGALLRGLDKRLTDKLNIPFHIAEDPLRAVARGTGIALKNVDIIKLILKYHFTIIFILLEIVSFSLIIRHNEYQRAIFSESASTLFGNISLTITSIKDYFRLKEMNESLANENILLKNRLEKYEFLRDTIIHGTVVQDSIPVYEYIGAKQVNATYNRTKNYITLNQGRKNGLQKEMAVCTPEGIVGLIQDLSDHFAVVIPLINVDSRISAKIKKNNYYGSLQWDGNDYAYSYLNDIPYHVEVNAGDTIVTSGLSKIFPEGIVVGYVESVDKETANFLKIKVKLAVDFKRINHVYVILNNKKNEQTSLEAINYHE